MAGQYFVLRLTAPDGYTASRAYSLSSPPEGPDGSDGDRADRRAARRRRGLELPARGRGSRATSWRCAGPIGGVLRLERRRPGAARRGRVRDRAADGDAAAGPPHRPRRTSSACSCRCARRATSTSPTSCPGRRRPSSTRGRPRPGSVRGVGRLALADVAPLVRGGETVFVCGSAAVRRGRDDLLLAAGVPVACDPGGALRAVRLATGYHGEHERERREHVRVRSTAVARRRRRAAPSWRHQTCRPGSTAWSAPGPPTAPSVPPSAPWPWSWGMAAIGVLAAGGVAAGRASSAPRAGFRRRHDIRRGAAGTRQGVEPRLVARSTAPAGRRPGAGRSPPPRG